MQQHGTPTQPLQAVAVLHGSNHAWYEERQPEYRLLFNIKCIQRPRQCPSTDHDQQMVLYLPLYFPTILVNPLAMCSSVGKWMGELMASNGESSLSGDQYLQNHNPACNLLISSEGVTSRLRILTPLTMESAVIISNNKPHVLSNKDSTYTSAS